MKTNHTSHCTCERFPVISDTCHIHGGASETIRRVRENARRIVVPMTSSTTDAAAVARIVADQQRAALRTIPMDLIEQEVYRRGRIVCVASACRFGDRLPTGYPPRAEDDEALPFEVE